jgi:hypothetical protein
MACLAPLPPPPPGCVSPGAATKPHPTPCAHRPDTPPKVRHYSICPCSAPPLLAQAPALAAGMRSRGAPNPTSTPIPLEPGLSPTPCSPDRPQTPTRRALSAPVVSRTLPRRPSSALSVESPVCCRQWVRFNYTLQNQHVSESITNTQRIENKRSCCAATVHWIEARDTLDVVHLGQRHTPRHLRLVARHAVKVEYGVIRALGQQVLGEVRELVRVAVVQTRVAPGVLPHEEGRNGRSSLSMQRGQARHCTQTAHEWYAEGIPCNTFPGNKKHRTRALMSAPFLNSSFTMRFRPFCAAVSSSELPRSSRSPLTSMVPASQSATHKHSWDHNKSPH